MPRRLFQDFSFGALLAAIALLVTAAPAAATGVVNGNFETGSFTGWGVNSLTGMSRWTVAERGPIEEEFQFAFPEGTGNHVAVTEYAAADTDLLSQELQLPAASNIALSLYLFYESAVPITVPSPNTLFVAPRMEGGLTLENQQVRIDILKANAPLESISPNDILATPYASQEGDPVKVDPKLISANLSAYAGQTVRLRIASAAGDGQMEVGVASVSLDATPLPQPQPQPIAEPIVAPLTGLIPGKLSRNRQAGSGELAVTLPGPGMLTVSDARRKVAIASLRSGAKPRPILIRTASAQTVGAQTVRVPIRPTAAAMKRLDKQGKLAFRLQLTFAPPGGALSTESYKGTLVKRLRPAPR